MQRAARDYVGGQFIEDAMTVVERFASDGITSTLGYWNTPDFSPRQVADEYLASILSVRAANVDNYISIKTPALNFSADLAAELGAGAQAHQVRIHCDSHGTEAADPTYAMLETMLQHCAADKLGTTLPGRWKRSLSDADWAIDRGIPVRVVKGEWPDPSDPRRDPAAGYLEVIDRLAGRAFHVAVATHKPKLAAEAVARLRAAGTRCGLELLFGLSTRAMLRWAKENNVPVRVYVPYGPYYLPYAINQLRYNPRILWWVLKNAVTRRS
jgi:proline dehydrogenase